MLSLSKLSSAVLQHLVEAVGETDFVQAQEVIEHLSPEEAFNKWCQYEGLINYGSRLIAVLDELRTAEVRPNNGLPKTIKEFTDRLTQAHKDGWDVCAEQVRNFLTVQQKEG